MAPPPPPPPGPPPPPMMPAPTAAPSGQERNLLLNSIRQGAKLKKTVTVDKSGPLIAGRVAGVTSSNNDSSRDVVSNNTPRVNGGPPGLGGLFAGGMPKLKPTGLGIGSTTNSSANTSPRNLTSDTKNRGPPPQPPPASQKPNIPSSASDSILTSSPANNGYPSRPMNGPPVLPSKPPVGGYGKPNVAPKPPVIREPSSPNQSALHSQPSSLSGSSQTLNDFRGGNSGSSQNLSNFSQNDQANKPSPPPKKISLNGRAGVNRAQSMRAPRSPPVAPTTNPPFPPNVRNNLVKNQSSLHQSQDSLNGSRNFLASKTGTLPHNFQKMAPLPPSIPPPPTPNQSQRGTPTRPPISKPPPPPSRPAAPPAPPPPPPHRTSPAPPPPPSVQGRLAPTAPCSGPPAPPQRNSSMRNGAHSYPTEIENRFSQHFHSVSEFPEPGAFRNLTKHYNTSSANAKQPAPQPPVHLQPATHVQLSTKLYPNNTSQC